MAAEVREAIGLPDPAATPSLAELPVRSREVVAISCPGTHRICVLVNQRYLRFRCKQKRCRHPEDPTGERFDVFHLFDLKLLGKQLPDEYEVRRS